MGYPKGFKRDVVRMFGDRGRKWLHELPGLLETAIKKWHLADCVLSSELSFNLVCFCKSPEFGEVALKMGVPHPELYTEMEVLALYAGPYVCKCYDSDTQLGAMLLERILPGEDLRTVATQAERVAVAAELFMRLPCLVPASHGLPSYERWIKRAFEMVRSTPGVDTRFRDLVEQADHLWGDLQQLRRPQVVLHGDLHHMNILNGGQHGWKAIDPKGVTGMRFLEVPPFIENQLEMVQAPNWQASLDSMVHQFAERMGESECVISQGLFVVSALRTSWKLEEHVAPDYDEMVTRLTRFRDCMKASCR